eukprot:CAMPEP_0172197828 /NCGR_PEP_ID=MMETSP1050-20130122/27715_1 /TAXON_ID=233186 /ORGANISM="Cryptomonas curvata, Strain CCAP979/52" /LENGTH=166 /DNA_ID=CAMNT_0012874515 /DNA_START=63 /DNA_END=560 /DNA_ORIENTATION=-
MGCGLSRNNHPHCIVVSPKRVNDCLKEERSILSRDICLVALGPEDLCAVPALTETDSSFVDQIDTADSSDANEIHLPVPGISPAQGISDVDPTDRAAPNNTLRTRAMEVADRPSTRCSEPATVSTISGAAAVEALVNLERSSKDGDKHTAPVNSFAAATSVAAGAA